MEDGSDHQVPIRVALPAHLRTVAGIPRGTTEVRVVVGAGDPDSEVRDGGQTESETISIAALLNAVEAAYPMLRGTIRGHHGGERRAHLRYFGEGQDLSFAPTNSPLPDSIVRGEEPFIVIGAISGG
jgi:hypothetical protein